MYTKDKVNTNVSRVLLISLLYTILFHLPVALHRMSLSATFHGETKAMNIAIIEIVIALFLTLSIFMLLSFSRYISLLFIPLFFGFGAASNYYLISFGKSFDIGVLQDIISVEWDMTQEFITLTLVLIVLASLILGIYLAIFRPILFNKSFNIFSITTIVIAFLIAINLDYAKHNFYTTRVTTQSYMPFNVFYNLDLYIRKHGLFKQQILSKTNIADLYDFKLKAGLKEPLVVVLVIGESMRGDLFYLNGKSDINNTPHLALQKNLHSFVNATSSASSTKESLPYMLTRAKAGKWEQATSETSVISAFKAMGFKTAWIGVQGIFRSFDFTYGAIALEADKVVSKADIRRDSNQDNIYDEYLLHYLDSFLNDHPKDNLFIVLHMYGSHWNFDQRYPSNFKYFKPTCEASAPSSCDRNQLLNSYNNTVLYSDWVLNEFIRRIEQKNAFLLYASDHGYSLFEKHFFGNAYKGDDYLQEQYDIAMFAWGSNKYLMQNSNRFKQLSAKQNASHDNIFHSLLGCINVDSNIIEQDLNLCN